ncbi:MAG: hypothetical protein PVF51_02575 [Nitrospirota bacterium]|jgi:hypothetical protein
MKATTNNIVTTGMKVGAVLGGMIFLIFGIVPGFHYGGYGMLMLLSKMAGGPVEATLIVRMLLVVGVLVGVCCAGALSIVLGSVFGTAAGVVVQAVSGGHAEQGEAAIEKH